MLKKIPLLFIVALATLCYPLIQPIKTKALAGSEFNASRIIDDGIFFNSNTMNTGDLQNFLNSKVPACDTYGTQPSSRAGYATRADWGRANGVGPPYQCLRDYSQTISTTSADLYCGGIAGGTKSAADIIFNVARACGINPQVLVVLLQKEQSLITDDWPWPIQYRSATGFGCPDTAECDSTYYGFFNQVYNAGRQFKRYIQQPQSFNYAVGRTSYVGYNPNAACGGTNLTPQTQATAALYNYTPYQPNAAALSNLYGTGDNCSAYGNRNFWRMFNDWFGSTKIDSFTIAFDPSTNAQYLLFGGLKQAIPDPETKIAWGIQSYPLVSMSTSYLSSLPSGPNLDRLTRLNTSDNTVFFMDGGKRYRVMSQSMFDSWNFGAMPITNVPPALFYNAVDGGELSYSFKGPSSETLYTPDGSDANGQTVIRPYSNNIVQKAWEGDNSSYIQLSASYFNRIDNVAGSTITSTKIINNGREYQVVDGGKMYQPNPIASLYPSTAQTVSNVTLNRLVDKGNASHLIRAANDNTVYMVDNQTKRPVANPNVLAAWTPQGSVVRIVNSSYIALLPNGQYLDKYASDSAGQIYIMHGTKSAVPSSLSGAYQGLVTTAITSQLMSLFSSSSSTLTGYLRGNNTPEVYLLDNSGNKRHIDGGDKATLMGAFNTGITLMPDSLVNTIPTASSPKLFVSDGSREYVIEGGKKHIVSTAVKNDWGLKEPQVYSDGTLNRFETGQDLVSKLRDGNNYYLVKGGRGFLTTDINIADTWSIKDAPQMNQLLIKNQIYFYMLTRFVRSTTDSRLFVIDNGNWYNLSQSQFSNLGGLGAPIMGLEPISAPNTISDWTSIVVKDSVGKHYIIDGGTKKDFRSAVIQNHWTNDGQLVVPTTTNGFLNLLPNNGKVERVIKGSGPAVFSSRNAIKQHILTSNTYNTYYAPYEQVSDLLINAMPTGSDIN